MHNTTICPICSKNDWSKIGTRMYNDADQYWNTPNFEFRKHIFFNIWNNGSSNVELKRHVCKTCGFVIDLPRPSIEDVSKKYQYLDSVREDMETTHNISEKSMKKEYKQSLEILNLVEPVLNNKFLDILDYGGGDGHMLIPMEKMGHKCYLVDYNKSPVSKIIRLGDTLDDIPRDLKFDLILCRHVIEHLASPKEFVMEFKNFLKKDGLIYAVVPIQLSNNPDPQKDPVTHINFFQEDSFRILFENAGYNTIISKKKRTTYHGNRRIVAQVLAKPDENSKTSYEGSYKTTLSYVFHRSLVKYFKNH